MTLHSCVLGYIPLTAIQPLPFTFIFKAYVATNYFEANNLHPTICTSPLLTALFFNLFFEDEPFAAIMIAHGTHGHSKNLSRGNREI